MVDRRYEPEGYEPGSQTIWFMCKRSEPDVRLPGSCVSEPDVRLHGSCQLIQMNEKRVNGYAETTQICQFTGYNNKI